MFTEIIFIADSYKSARDVEKTVSELSASDDNLTLPENNSNKRLIKKRTFFGDTSSEEGIYDQRRNKSARLLY